MARVFAKAKSSDHKYAILGDVLQMLERQYAINFLALFVPKC